jgi:tRNA uridine 5-carbamoylmethylation protein Kti12
MLVVFSGLPGTGKTTIANQKQKIPEQGHCPSLNLSRYTAKAA